MFLISGNTALIVRAARMVLTCRPCSGATSAISTCGAFLEATCHRDARDAERRLAGERHWPVQRMQPTTPWSVRRP